MQDKIQYSKLNNRFNPWSLLFGVPEYLSLNVETKMLIVIFSDSRLQVSIFTFLEHQFYIVNAARIPLGLPHDPTFAGGRSSLPLTWVNALYTLWKKRCRYRLPAQGKLSVWIPGEWGPSSPVLLFLHKERLWSNIAMQTQITMSNIWKWTYSDILLIKYALVKRHLDQLRWIPLR